MRNEAIRLIDDDELPGGHEWMIVRDTNGRTAAFVKRSAASPRVLAEVRAGLERVSRRDRLRPTG